MPIVQPIAVLVSDLHLTLKQPACRADKDWMDVQAEYLGQLKKLAAGFPILCAGDIFDRWNPSPELINFALDHLPDGMLCVPGQHDLPNHSLEEMDRSGYGVLKRSTKIEDLTDGSISISAHPQGPVIVDGFGWNQVIKPPSKDERKASFQIAVIHRYCWIKGSEYPGAPETSNASSFKDELKGYTIAVFGDNHKKFITKSGNCTVVNCGGFIRRKSDEIDYRPAAWVLYSDGTVKPKFFDTCIDRFHENVEKRESTPFDMRHLIEEMKRLGEEGINFREAVLHHLDANEIDKATRQIILKAMEPNE